MGIVGDVARFVTGARRYRQERRLCRTLPVQFLGQLGWVAGETLVHGRYALQAPRDGK